MLASRNVGRFVVPGLLERLTKFESIHRARFSLNFDLQRPTPVSMGVVANSFHAASLFSSAKYVRLSPDVLERGQGGFFGKRLTQNFSTNNVRSSDTASTKERGEPKHHRNRGLKTSRAKFRRQSSGRKRIRPKNSSIEGAFRRLQRGNKVKDFFRLCGSGQTLRARKIIHSCIPSVNHSMSNTDYQSRRYRMRDALYTHLIYHEAKNWQQVRHALIDGHAADIDNDAVRFMRFEKCQKPFLAALERVCYPRYAKDSHDWKDHRGKDLGMVIISETNNPREKSYIIESFEERARAVHEIVQAMKDRQIVPTVKTLSTLVIFERDRVGGPNLEKCRMYFELAFGGTTVEKANLERDEINKRKMFNALISVCAQAGNLTEANDYFERMLFWRDETRNNKGIRSSPEADQSDSSARICGLRDPDIFTLNGLLSACARMYREDPSSGSFISPSDIKAAEKYFDLLVYRERVRPDVHSFAILLDCCIKQPGGADIERIDRLYATMRSDRETLLELMRGPYYTGKRKESNSLSVANFLDDRLWFGDIQPNAFIFQTMINASANLFRSNALSSLHHSGSVKGDMVLAENYMSLCVAEEEKSCSQGLIRNVEMYNAMITCCARQLGGALSDCADELFTEMKSLGLQPDLLTYNALIDCASKPQQPQTELVEEHARILRGHDLVQNEKASMSTEGAAAFARQMEETLSSDETFSQLDTNDFDELPSANDHNDKEAAYTAEFVDELEQHLWWQGGSDLALAEYYFQLMQSDGRSLQPCEPDAATYGALLTACANYRCRGSPRTGEERLEIEAVVARAWEYYELLCSNDKPNQVHLTQMLTVLGNAGKYEEAVEFFEAEVLEKWKCRPTSVTISALVSIAEKAGDSARVDSLCFGNQNLSRRKDYASTIREKVITRKSPTTSTQWNPGHNVEILQDNEARRLKDTHSAQNVRSYRVNLHYLNTGEAKAVLRNVLRDRILAQYDKFSGGGIVVPAELLVITGVGGRRIDSIKPVLPRSMREYMESIPGPVFSNSEKNPGCFFVNSQNMKKWLEMYGLGQGGELRW